MIFHTTRSHHNKATHAHHAIKRSSKLSLQNLRPAPLQMGAVCMRCAAIARCAPEGGTKEYPLRRIPAPSARVRHAIPRWSTRPSGTTHAQGMHIPRCHLTQLPPNPPAQRPCTGAVSQPLEQHSCQPNKQTEQRKEHSIFHIKKNSLFVPNLLPTCSQNVPTLFPKLLGASSALSISVLGRFSF